MEEWSTKADVLGLLASESADHLADYISRGRKHQSLSDLELTDAWKRAFKIMGDNVREYDLRRAEEDLKQEFLARGTEPPYELIKEEMERFVSQVDLAMKEMETNDPEAHERADRAIQADVEKYRKRMQN